MGDRSGGGGAGRLRDVWLSLVAVVSRYNGHDVRSRYFRTPGRDGLAWVVVLLFLAPATAAAQREVRWQIDPWGFPDEMSILVDVREGDEYTRDLDVNDFAVSVDEYVGDQGGLLRNAGVLVPGSSGVQLLLVVDRSRTYTGSFSRAKLVLTEVVSRLDPARDRIGIATTPAVDSGDDATLAVPFTNDGVALRRAIAGLRPRPSSDKATARVCHALDEALRFFPEEKTERFRAVIYVSAGVDRGEGRGACLQRSFEQGKVPLYLVTYEPDRRFRDDRSEHRLENRLEELAEKTGGRSVFRRESRDGDRRFIDALWRRARNQYLLKLAFPCFRPAPTIEHIATLKVEGRDAEAIRFRAASVLAPTPTIAKITPTSATRAELDDGQLELIIDGTGFCGTVSTVRAWVGARQIGLKSLTPFRLVATLNEGVERGNIKVVNRFGQSGSSASKFGVVEPGRGTEAGSALGFLVLMIVVIALASIVFLAIRSRRLRAAPAHLAPGAAVDTDSNEGAQTSRDEDLGASPAQIHAAATMKANPLRRAWLERAGGEIVDLSEGYNLIGCDEAAKISLDVEGVSREHARLELVSVHGVLWLEDLGSTNGTLWGRGGARGPGQKRIDGRVRVDDGDVIVIGGESMTVRCER